MFEILGKTSIDFMGWRRYSFGLSSMLLLLGIIALVQIARGTANLGIDFAGGTAVQVKFERPVSIEHVRAGLANHGWSHVELQDLVTENKLLIWLKAQTAMEDKVAERVLDAIRRELPRMPLPWKPAWKSGRPWGTSSSRMLCLPLPCR